MIALSAIVLAVAAAASGLTKVAIFFGLVAVTAAVVRRVW